LAKIFAGIDGKALETLSFIQRPRLYLYQIACSNGFSRYLSNALLPSPPPISAPMYACPISYYQKHLPLLSSPFYTSPKGGLQTVTHLGIVGVWNRVPAQPSPIMAETQENILAGVAVEARSQQADTPWHALAGTNDNAARRCGCVW
jgi:hypothetical protein